VLKKGVWLGRVGLKKTKFCNTVILCFAKEEYKAYIGDLTDYSNPSAHVLHESY
jgi:hypothetical protein